MELYEVTNGYMGVSTVRVYVLADNKERAIELAREKFILSGYSRNTLNAELMCNTGDGEFCSMPSDEGFTMEVSMHRDRN